jgi:hypothetical protein
MKRKILRELERWKNSPVRCSLIVRGARQVGKSWAITEFGKHNFDSVVIADFEKKPELINCFHSLEPNEMIKRLEFYLKKEILPGKTLLFLDEIQLCPRAITSLRYFKEELPQLHVASAGSLLEFVLNDEQFSFPVGRVEFLYMRPMSFIEFLEALGESSSSSFIQSISLHAPIDEKTHQKLLDLVRAYFWIGGMPEVVKTYMELGQFDPCKRVLERQIAAFQQDFGKYAKNAKPEYLKILFRKIPELVGHHFKYSKVDPHASNPARDYKLALKQLELAGLVYPINDTHANGVPLQAEINEKKFKPLLLDIGLLQSALGVDQDEFKTKSLLDFYHGALAEQFVGQEMLAYSDPHHNQKLYFWESDHPGSSAEVDFVISLHRCIFPIEVKASLTGHLRSLKRFMELKSTSIGIKISEAPLQMHNNILNIPFYLISSLPKLVQEAELLQPNPPLQ